MAVLRQNAMKVLARNRRGRSRTGSVFAPSFPNRSDGQEQNGYDPESPHGVRSLRCGGDGSLKTRTEGSGCLLLTRQHSTFDQDRHTRIWIDAAQGLPGDSTRFDNLLIPTSDFLNSIPQTKRNFP